jgi:cation diffusion facilitator CzcD-associated flavoprotein CzcO/acetyl esterase/lipase
MAVHPPGVHEAIIIGGGFGGIGMGVTLRSAGIEDFLILERAADVGGVWRDNGYPGAACDVPSHLYSFSFEPNPDWSRTFASRDEIHAYLRHCVDKYRLAAHLRLSTRVEGADYDEPAQLWRVRLAGGAVLAARILISATGQLSNPALPRIEGIGSFRGPAFHSARWDHEARLDGRRVAVIGTGASATQFVPELAKRAERLLVFQRSPSYLIPRPDRAYRPWEHALFRRAPWAMRLHRAWIYTRYEMRALAFTRFQGMLEFAGGRPFRRMLREQVPDPAMRERLLPAYPPGCKRILLSSDYLATLVRRNVALVTEPIARIAPDGIVTRDGTLHRVDAIVYGTGFAATRFLAPMRITGRGGRDLNDAWLEGASSWLGMAMPGFPNFFMLYGPNTNLGHNSIVYMLESQFAHVLRCLRAMRRTGASEIDVNPHTHREYNAGLQARLARSAWAGCRSWYLDERGRNTTNWPGFSLGYRWLARHASLGHYRFSRPADALPGATLVLPPPSALETLSAAQTRALLRGVFRPLVGPPFGLGAQRRAVDWLSALMRPDRKTRREARLAGRCAVEVVVPDGCAPHAGAILYVHGGAFCVGSPATHRSLTTRLARAAGMTVWAPDYRLAPEHRYPAGLDDVLACMDAMLGSGLDPARIVVAGDSAGATLALALLLRLRERGGRLPAGAALLSPLTDLTLAQSGGEGALDPMIRPAWVRQCLDRYGCPPAAPEHRPLETDLSGLPPLLVQVGTEEMLLSDATRLATHARACGVACALEIYQGRWHNFQLQAMQLATARNAIAAVGEFARARVAAACAAVTA